MFDDSYLARDVFLTGASVVEMKRVKTKRWSFIRYKLRTAALNEYFLILIGPDRNKKPHAVFHQLSACFTDTRPRTHWQFYPTREPFANSSRRVARVHTASTASGSSGTLRPHQDVFAVDANGSRRLGSAV